MTEQLARAVAAISSTFPQQIPALRNRMRALGAHYMREPAPPNTPDTLMAAIRGNPLTRQHATCVMAAFVNGARAVTGVEAPADGDDDPVLGQTLKPDVTEMDYELIVDLLQAALAEAREGYYQRGGKIVRAGYFKGKDHKGESIENPATVILPQSQLVMALDGAIELRQRSMSAQDIKKYGAFKIIPISEKLITMLVERGDKLRLPVLRSLVHTPQIFPNGRVLDKPGYDFESGILYDPRKVTFPPIPEKPTRDDALAAWDTIVAPLRAYTWGGDPAVSLAVAVSLIMTAFVRATLPLTPCHIVTSPVRGAGKGKIVSVASIVATGEAAAVMSMGHNADEFDKRLVGSILSGQPIIAIDNVTEALTGDTLNQLMTEEKMKLRALGSSDTFTIQNTFLLSVTGNNVVTTEDMTRRSIQCVIDPGVETPEDREFDFDPMAAARETRPAIVVAIITMLRAYLISGDKMKLGATGSFEDWSNFVRAAIVWLDKGDPWASKYDLVIEDPERDATATLMAEWHKVYGGKEVMLKDVVKDAKNAADAGARDLWDAIVGVLGSSEWATPEKLNGWLRRKKDKIIDGYKVTSRHGRARSTFWGVADLDTTRRAAHDKHEDAPF